MTTLTKHTTIDAPPADVFAYLLDPNKCWVDIATRRGDVIHDITTTPDGPGTTFVWESRMLGFHVTGTITYTVVEPNDRLVISSTKGFVFGFTLEPEGEGTKLTLAEEDVPANWVEAAVDAVAMKLTERDLDTWLAMIKDALETAKS